MNFRKNDRLQQLANIAFGEPAELDLTQASPTLLKRIEELRQVVGIARSPWFYAEDRTKNVAKLICEQDGRRLFELPMLLSNRQLAGVRSTATDDSIHAVFGEGDVKVRLTAQKSGSGWEIRGEVTGDSCLIESDNARTATDESGRFIISVSDLMNPLRFFGRKICFSVELPQ